ncbi:glycosyltransferase family 2 protein [Williamsia deligens]|uniref:glycosyltransferase family 2 protein n=1 Tax=Williamsia deligens TaxID=321325 RepID=UPI0020A571C5|nr:glycosyltransferase family A protein [Williamsia deligens]
MHSALDQTAAVLEILVVADTIDPVQTGTDDPRVTVIHTGSGHGPARARQLGVERASGDIVALLDDDDLWHPFKIERQLIEVDRMPSGSAWVMSTRAAMRRTGKRDRVIPRALMPHGTGVLQYLFTRRSIRSGDAMIQSSTMCFPRELALRTPLDGAGCSPHDEPGWLAAVERDNPGLVIRHAPECLTIMRVDHPSVSRTVHDDSHDYIAWGLEHLGSTTARARGDYFLTNPVVAAVAGGSPHGVWRSITTGVRAGRPGASAILFACLQLVRSLVGAAMPGGRRSDG